MVSLTPEKVGTIDEARRLMSHYVYHQRDDFIRAACRSSLRSSRRNFDFG